MPDRTLTIKTPDGPMDLYEASPDGDAKGEPLLRPGMPLGSRAKAGPAAG